MLRIILSLLVFQLPVLGLATTFVNRPLGDVVKESGVIVRGKAGDSYSDWDKGGRRQIFTYTNLTVTDVLKGELKETKILLRQPGGSKDGMEMNVPGAANFNSDEDVVVLLSEKNKEDGSYDVPGFSTGKYNVVNGENGEPVLINSMGGAAMYDPRKDARTLSYNSKIPLEVFKRIAKGEDIPEAAHTQFHGSQKEAPAGAYEAHHHHPAPTAKPTVPATPDVKASAEVSAPQDQAPVREDREGVWIAISFATLAIIGGAILWWVFKSKGG